MTDRLTTYILRTLLALTAIGLIVAVAAHVIGGRLAAAAFVAAYLVWMLSEARITVGTPNQSAAETRTLVPYAIARVTTATHGRVLRARGIREDRHRAYGGFPCGRDVTRMGDSRTRRSVFAPSGTNLREWPDFLRPVSRAAPSCLCRDVARQRRLCRLLRQPCQYRGADSARRRDSLAHQGRGRRPH